MKKRKLTRKGLKELELSMPKLSEIQQKTFVGGGDGSYLSPYTWDEYTYILSNDTWFGGYVEGYGYINSGSYYGSGSYGDSGSFYDTSGSYEDSGPYNDPSGDYPWINQWYSLTESERNFIKQNPGFAVEFYNNSKTANEKTQALSGQHNGYGDAVRHCYWSALNQMSTAYNLIPYAELYGNAHEDNPNQPEEEKNMDLHNNKIGYELGRQALLEGWDADKLYEECLKAANEGRLITLQQD